MLWRRLVGAALVVPPILLLFWCESHLLQNWPGAFLLPLALLAAFTAASEAVSWLQKRDLPVMPWSVCIACPLVIGTAYFSAVWYRNIAMGAMGAILAIAGVMMFLFLDCMRRYAFPQRWLSTLSHSLFVVVYLSVPISMLILLRLIEPDRRGLLAIFSLLLVVKMSDVGAFFAGRNFGRRKLAPLLSPAKTVAGAIGGMAMGATTAVLSLGYLSSWVAPDEATPPWISAAGFGVSVTLAGMLGDLSESLLKRDLQIKDSG
ncbi:MAG: phosphatidate cytidylyltransferase, partial [Planctomycetota bacterium]|nr:phosphatidate cytidylyltransferase [Planctomycetota bacterium]